MNEPLDSATQEQPSADQIERSEAARLAFFIVGGAAVVWLAFGPGSNEPRWLWLSHVVVFLAYCLFLIRGFWTAWIAKRNCAPEKPVSTLQMLLFTVVILILWDLMPLAAAEVYEFLGFDVFWDRGADTNIDEDIRIARRHGFETLVLHHDGVTARKVRKIRSAGLEIGAWTVNDQTTMKMLLDMGIQRLYTDQPRKLLALLAKRDDQK